VDSILENVGGDKGQRLDRCTLAASTFVEVGHFELPERESERDRERERATESRGRLADGGQIDRVEGVQRVLSDQSFPFEKDNHLSPSAN